MISCEGCQPLHWWTVHLSVSRDTLFLSFSVAERTAVPRIVDVSR